MEWDKIGTNSSCTAYNDTVAQVKTLTRKFPSEYANRLIMSISVHFWCQSATYGEGSERTVTVFTNNMNNTYTTKVLDTTYSGTTSFINSRGSYVDAGTYNYSQSAIIGFMTKANYSSYYQFLEDVTITWYG